MVCIVCKRMPARREGVGISEWVFLLQLAAEMRLRPFCFPIKWTNNASTAKVRVSSYPDNIPKSLWKKLCLTLSFLTRNLHGRTRPSTSAERRHDLSTYIHGRCCVIWSQALIFQGFNLLTCKWRSWLNFSMPGPHFRPHLLRETIPAQPI